MRGVRWCLYWSLLTVLLIKGYGTASEGSQEEEEAIDALAWIYSRDEPEDAIVVVHCFQEQKNSCCRSIMQLESIREHEMSKGMDGDEVLLRRLCDKHLVHVPPIRGHDRQHEHKPVPSYLLVFRPNHETRELRWAPPAKPSVASNELWKRYRWTQQEASDMVNTSWQLLKDTTATVDESSDYPAFTALLESTLSEAGGMHRDLTHSLVLDDLPDDGASFFSIWMLLHVPTSIFINPEDAFRIHQPSNNNVTVRFVTSSVIDQEEPAFASPSHAVMVHVQGQISQQQTRTIGWDTLLHWRYPMPMQGDFSDLYLLEPSLVAGELWQDEANRTTRSLRVLPWNAAPQFITTWIAVGHSQDYPIVLGLTFLAAMVGTVVLLRDVSRVAHWE